MIMRKAADATCVDNSNRRATTATSCARLSNHSFGRVVSARCRLRRHRDRRCSARSTATAVTPLNSGAQIDRRMAPSTEPARRLSGAGAGGSSGVRRPVPRRRAISRASTAVSAFAGIARSTHALPRRAPACRHAASARLAVPRCHRRRTTRCRAPQASPRNCCLDRANSARRASERSRTTNQAAPRAQTSATAPVAAAPENPRSIIPIAIAARMPAAARTPSTARANGADDQRSHHLQRDVRLGRDQVRRVGDQFAAGAEKLPDRRRQRRRRVDGRRRAAPIADSLTARDARSGSRRPARRPA